MNKNQTKFKQVGIIEIFNRAKLANDKIKEVRLHNYYKDISFFESLGYNEKSIRELLDKIMKNTNIYNNILIKEETMIENIILKIEKVKSDYLMLTEKEYNILFKIDYKVQ